MTISTIDTGIQKVKKINEEQQSVNFEEALLLTGYGNYNYGLISVCSITLMAMGMDLYAMSFVVPAAACDLNLTVSQRGILSAISFMGVIVSSHTWGYLSDTRGRRFILKWAMWMGFLFSFLSGFSPNWISLGVFKFFATAFTSAANSASFTLLGESSPSHARSRALLLMSTCILFSQGTIALIAWPLLPLTFAPSIDFLGIYYRPWRLLIQLIALVSGISALTLQFVHESPKFLASQGRLDEALAVLQKIYATNTGHYMENYPVHKLYFDEEQVSKNTSVLRSMWEQTVPLFKMPLLANTLKIYHIFIVVYGTCPAFIMWYPTILNSYINAESAETASGNNLCKTLSISGVPILKGNSTMDEVCDDQIQDITVYAMLVLAIVSVILSLMITRLVRWTGKRVIVFLVLAVGSMCGILCNLVYNPTIGLGLLLIFQIQGVCLGLISTFCVDLYPTKVRGMAVCLAIMVGRTSGFIGISVVGLLLEVNCESAFYVFGLLSLSGIISAYLLPIEPTLQASAKNSDS